MRQAISTPEGTSEGYKGENILLMKRPHFLSAGLHNADNNLKVDMSTPGHSSGYIFFFKSTFKPNFY